MDEFSITVTIADRTYRLTIERKEEEVVRQAVRLIDEKVKEYARNYAFKDKQDLLAMVTLQNTTALLHQQNSHASDNKDLGAKLSLIDKLLTDKLDKQNVL
jgi:cell division protein ZapA